MPPGRKRKASAVVGTPAKKVRIGAATDIPDQSPLSPAGRPKRTSVSEPQYDFTKHRRSTSAQNVSSPTSKTEPAKKPRRRPPKAAAASPEVPAKPRGRPPKTASPSETAVRGRGRPPKKATSEPQPTARGRGRPRKESIASTPVATDDTTTKMKKRGRPLKTTTDSPELTARAATNKKAPPKASTPAKRGRTPQALLDTVNHDIEDETDSELPVIPYGDRPILNNTEANEDLTGIDPDTQYWLMKAEPDSRIEKGHDVKFSIDDLAARTEPEAWDGVRNPQARNYMRNMRKDDLAFFYHSNCSIPGIAGVMRVVAEHSPDESAFDPEHPYFDAKSDRAKPKWDCVKVEFVKKFDELITLRELKSFARPNGALENMQTIKQSRLSVTAVTPAEWRFILQVAGEPISLGHGDIGVSGYEAELDGEGEDAAGTSDIEGINDLSETDVRSDLIRDQIEAANNEEDAEPVDEEIV